MIDKCKENPNFGSTKKMEGELKAATQKINTIEAELESLKSYHENLINYTSSDTLRWVSISQSKSQSSPSQRIRCQWLSDDQQVRFKRPDTVQCQ